MPSRRRCRRTRTICTFTPSRRVGGATGGTMKRSLAGALAAGLLALTAPASRATGESIVGGCFFVADDPLVSGEYVGVIGDDSVTRDALGLPTYATVHCKLRNNGADVP